MNVFDLVAKISLDSSEYESKLKTAGNQMKAVGTKLSAVGATLTKRVTAPIVALGGLSIKAFNEVKDGLNIVTKKTGASGKALQDMHQTVKNLASDIPASFEEIGTAVGEVNTRFNIAGQELEDLSGQFVKFSKVNGTDLNTSIDTTQKALAAFGLEAKDASGLLDTMTKVGQDTGVSMDTLMNGLVQNGTAFQELGLSIDQSVSLMGQLDKSGANSETVMQGLRRALKNAAKDGKPLNKALEELQDSIVNGKDGMDGLTQAYELFGRSGDQIYGAVKNGTIDFTKLAGAASDASGVLDKTFEETLTPAEKFKTTLNSLKTAGYELGNTTLGMIQPAIEKLSKKIQELASKWQSLDKGTKESIIKFAGLAAAIGPVLVVSGKLTGAISSLVKGFGGLFGLISAHPIGALVVAGTAAAGALYAMQKANLKTVEAQYELNEEQQKSIDTINDTTKAYEEANKARVEATETAVSEAQYATDLVDEYNGLIDANGKVKKGYEDRANFIKGQLADSLGIEKGKIDELIDANGKLDAKVKQLIETKKAEAILDANKDAYVEAIKARQTAVEELGPALVTLQETEKNVGDTQKALDQAQQDYYDHMSGNSVTRAQYAKSLDEADAAHKKAVESYKTAKTSVDEYTKTLGDAENQIKNYEGLAESLAANDTAAIQRWVSSLSEGIKTRENATREELQAQAKAIAEEYKLIKEAYDSGNTNITQDMVDAAEKRMKAAQTEAGSVSASSAQEKNAVVKNSREAAQAQKNSSSNAKQGVTSDYQQTQRNIESSTSAAASSAKTHFSEAASAATNSAATVKGAFPVNLGQLFHGTLVKITTAVKEKAGGAKDIDQRLQRVQFAKAMNQPYMFTKPTLFDTNKIAGEAGDEMLYGKKSLMNDIGEAVKANSGNGNIVVNLNYDASDDATEMLRDISRGIRRYKMAGVI